MGKKYQIMAPRVNENTAREGLFSLACILRIDYI
jgi:hypothetical protein